MEKRVDDPLRCSSQSHDVVPYEHTSDKNLTPSREELTQWTVEQASGGNQGVKRLASAIVTPSHDPLRMVDNVTIRDRSNLQNLQNLQNIVQTNFVQPKMLVRGGGIVEDPYFRALTGRISVQYPIQANLIHVWSLIFLGFDPEDVPHTIYGKLLALTLGKNRT
ncbi:hypothetical protein YC2023_082932 [Brassica napus]